MDKLICLKLSTGEEVIGKLSNETETSVAIKDVASVMMMPGSVQGQVGLGLMPFLPYSEKDTLEFSKSFIIVSFEPNTDMLNNYNRMFGAGIQIAKSI